MIIVLFCFVLALHVHCHQGNSHSITLDEMGSRLEQFGHRVISHQPGHPTGLMPIFYEIMGGEKNPTLQLVDVACQVAKDSLLEAVFSNRNVASIIQACSFIEGIAATALVHSGLTSAIADFQNLFPVVCTEVRSSHPQAVNLNEQDSQRWPTALQYYGRITAACDYLESLAVSFLTAFAKYGFTKESVNPKSLKKVLSETGGFVTQDIQHRITYDQVSTMLPHVCQGKPHQASGQFLPEACRFFKRRTSAMLKSISQILEDSRITHKEEAIEKYHDHGGKAYCYHQAKPFIYTTCVESEMDWDFGSSNYWKMAACDYFLMKHMEAMVKPKVHN